MFRGFVAAAMFAGGASVFQSQHSATIVLTNGDRVTGIASFPAEPQLVSLRLTRSLLVVAPDGRQTSVAIEEVAVIDFAGGKPTAAELEALHSDTPHVMTLRNGNARGGRLIGLVGGEFVRWESSTGVRVDVPMRNVSRIYVNQDVALAIFGGRGPDRGDDSSWTSWLERGFLARPQVPVAGGAPWTDSRLDVRAGERVRFITTGEIVCRSGETASPAGLGATRRTDAPLPDQPLCALIGRVESAVFFIGSRAEAIAMPASGRLMLGVNDDSFQDNSGTLRVLIRQQ